MTRGLIHSPAGATPRRSRDSRPGFGPAGASPRPDAAARRAFTLLELLVVLAIIGVLAAVALPSISGMRKSNVMANAVAQLTADFSNARQTAIRERTTVHVIFVPPDILTLLPNSADLRDSRTWTNLLTHPYSSYAFYAERTVGDQPGQSHPRYIGAWRTLPDGITIADWEFKQIPKADWDNPNLLTNRPFATDTDKEFPFPTVNGNRYFMPHVSFDSTGSLIAKDSGGKRVLFQDEIVSLARASILAQRAPDGSIAEFDWRESPPNNSRNDYNRIRIDGLTGRARVERQEIK